MIIRAFAKINISLKIVGFREDGYHLLESFMQSLPDVYDVIEVVESEKTEITCSDSSLSCGEDNIVYKALKLMGRNAKVHIEKHIPIAAGLAGGSADGAAIIYAFMGASDEAFEIASKLGADVPFSLLAISRQGRCAAFATGTGTELSEKEPVKGVIITRTPNIQVSTPLVYKEYDRMPINTEANDLQPAAIRLFPEIQDTIDEMSKAHPVYGGPIMVRQSGSGPTVFAIYKEEEK